MQIVREEKNGVVMLLLKEERLDAHNSGDLKSMLLAEFQSGHNQLLVNLKEVRFIDSSGLGALVSGFKNAISSQGGLKLCALQSQVRSMFELTRLHRVFEIFPSVEEALESF